MDDDKKLHAQIAKVLAEQNLKKITREFINAGDKLGEKVPQWQLPESLKEPLCAASAAVIKPYLS